MTGEWAGTALPVALLLALATAVLLLPPRRERPVAGRRPRGGGASAEDGARRVTDASGSDSSRAVPELAGELDIGLVLTEVATLLRAGATPQRAWERALGRAGVRAGVEPGDDGVPPVLRALAEAPVPSWLPSFSRSEGSTGAPGRGRGSRRGLPLPDPAAARRARAARAAAPGAVAACRLTAELGAPLAGILETVADGVAEAGHADSSRRTALSGPRATARLLACLPLLGLLLGQAVGAHPSEVLLDGGWGSALGLLGIGLMALGQLLTVRLVRAAEGEADVVDEALVLDLAGAALGAGASLPGALQALGAALDEEPLAVVGRALLLGASWGAAWRAPEDAGWRARRARLEQSLRPGWEDGASPGPLLAGTARALRAGRASRDEEAAERLAVRLVVPLGLCFLPAFVVLGIVPVIAGVGLDLLAA